MGWREEFNKADISMDPLGYWWTVFGPIGVLSVLMSGIATGFTSIAQYGLGAIVFAGVGAACVIMFAASALMVSWRYFNPLQKQPAIPSEGQDVSTQDTSSRLAEAERGIAQNKAGLQEVRTKAEMSTQDISSRLAGAERGITHRLVNPRFEPRRHFEQPFDQCIGKPGRDRARIGDRHAIGP